MTRTRMPIAGISVRGTAATIVLAAALTAGLGLAPPVGVRPALAACDPGTKIDASTANDARKKIAAAGYKQPHDLKKGCDNYWHGQATKDGAPVYVVLSPQGQVYQEGD